MPVADQLSDVKFPVFIWRPRPYVELTPERPPGGGVKVKPTRRTIYYPVQEGNADVDGESPVCDPTAVMVSGSILVYVR